MCNKVRVWKPGILGCYSNDGFKVNEGNDRFEKELVSLLRHIRLCMRTAGYVFNLVYYSHCSPLKLQVQLYSLFGLTVNTGK